ncbi:MAG: TSUP family transporter [Oscillospiraceae bacterium]|nr:TSUP family transporter [Oscillospiraceae bacterium]
MTDKWKNRIAGTAGGLINGLFGGGGGMVVLPLLTKWSTLEARAAFATCVAIIFPMCCASTAVYLFQVRPALSLVLPYLAGGLAGGLIGGLTFEKVPVRFLKAVFGLFLLYGGVRYLLW